MRRVKHGDESDKKRTGECGIDLFERVSALISSGDIMVSEHGYDELADDDPTVREIIAGLDEARVVEEYPEYPKGPCVLLL